MPHPILVFTTPAYGHFLQGLCEIEGFAEGQWERIAFSDGEIYRRLTAPVRNRDVVLVGGTISHDETLDLYDMACGLVQYGANTLTLVVPYYGYSTMERAVKPGDIVTGKNRALLLSSIPKARLCNEIVMIDLHTPGIAHYLEGHMRPYHLYSKRLFKKVFHELPDREALVLASTDAGRAKWVESLANDLGLPAAFAYKRRLQDGTTRIRGINADVKDRHVVIYDDMIRTGGTLIRAAEAYAKAGARTITATTTHGIFTGEALERLFQSGLFEKIIASDTHPRALELARGRYAPFLQIRSMIPHVADFLLDREGHREDFLLDS